MMMMLMMITVLANISKKKASFKGVLLSHVLILWTALK